MLIRNRVTMNLLFGTIALGACSRDDLAPYENGLSENIIPVTSSREIVVDPRGASVDGSINAGGGVLASQVDNSKKNDNGKSDSVEVLGGIDPEYLDDVKSSNKENDSLEIKNTLNAIDNKVDMNPPNKINIPKKELPKHDKVKVEKDITVRPIEGKIISSFGNLDDDGISIKGNLGQKVSAFKNGKVKYAGNKKLPEYGNMVIIEHKDKLVSVYAYLQDISVKEGQVVKAGDKIGTVGKSGEGIQSPQLYFQLMKNEEPIDPMKYF